MQLAAPTPCFTLWSKFWDDAYHLDYDKFIESLKAMREKNEKAQKDRTKEQK